MVSVHKFDHIIERQRSDSVSYARVGGGGGGGRWSVLPYVNYTGKCRHKGYGF